MRNSRIEKDEGGALRMKLVPLRNLPIITSSQMRKADRLMTDELGISLVQMMENAGRSLAQLTLELYEPKSVTVLSGRGGNGGGGLVAARHLVNRGVDVEVVVPMPRDGMNSTTKLQFDALAKMGIDILPWPRGHRRSEVIVDALIGYSLSGNPKGSIADLIVWANKSNSPIISLDVPSGFDAEAGIALALCIQAEATLTIAAPKKGLFGLPQTGRLFLADISVPTSIFAKWGYGDTDYFDGNWIVEVVNPVLSAPQIKDAIP